MNTDNNVFEYQDCTLENLLTLMNEIFGSGVTENSIVQDLCEGDVRKMDSIQEGISKLFGIDVTINMLNSPTVSELQETIEFIKKNPNYPESERMARARQLRQIAEGKDISPLTGTLEKASAKLQKGLDEIKNITSPTVGYQTQYEWLNKSLDFVDRKVSKEELRKVISQLDQNNQTAFSNLGGAISATNEWIDAICGAIIWIVQIENDLYDISKESSYNEINFSRLLSKDGKNIEGLAKFTQDEKEKRQRIQQKLKEFKANIEGKIDFLNHAHQRLQGLFEEHQQTVGNDFQDIRKSLDQQLSNALDNIRQAQEALAKAHSDFIDRTQLNVSSKFSDLENKLNAEFEALHQEQQRELTAIRHSFEEKEKGIDRLTESLKENQAKFIEESDSKAEKFKAEQQQSYVTFMLESKSMLDDMKRQVNIYKIVSIASISISIAMIVLNFVM